jgi:hypothetical protein
LKVEAAAWLEDGSCVCDQCPGEDEHVQNEVHALLICQDIGHIRKNLTDQTCKHLNSAYLTYLSCHENNEKNYAGMKATPHIN